MPNPRIDSAARQFSSSRQFGLPNESRRTQIAVRPPEDPNLAADQGQPHNASRSRRPLNPEKFAVKKNQTCCHRRPRSQQSNRESRRRARSPKLTERMHHKPVDRNRQLQKQHDRCQPPAKAHGRILVGAALAAQGDSDSFDRCPRSAGQRQCCAQEKSQARDIVNSFA